MNLRHGIDDSRQRFDGATAGETGSGREDGRKGGREGGKAVNGGDGGGGGGPMAAGRRQLIWRATRGQRAR